MFINWHRREINFKIVYYGPAMSGKTTNLEQIYGKIDPAHRSDLVSLKTQEDRTLYFDFLQLELGKINNFTPYFHLYTVPGHTYYEASRKLVLKGADGVVFVVDSISDRMKENQESWESLKSHFKALEMAFDRVPVTIQYNKQDMGNALRPEILIHVLGLQSYPYQEAVALQGKGVFETLRSVIGSVVKNAVTS